MLPIHTFICSMRLHFHIFHILFDLLMLLIYKVKYGMPPLQKRNNLSRHVREERLDVLHVKSLPIHLMIVSLCLLYLLHLSHRHQQHLLCHLYFQLPMTTKHAFIDLHNSVPQNILISIIEPLPACQVHLPLTC